MGPPESPGLCYVSAQSSPRAEGLLSWMPSSAGPPALLPLGGSASVVSTNILKNTALFCLYHHGVTQDPEASAATNPYTIYIHWDFRNGEPRRV